MFLVRDWSGEKEMRSKAFAAAAFCNMNKTLTDEVWDVVKTLRNLIAPSDAHAVLSEQKFAGIVAVLFQGLCPEQPFARLKAALVGYFAHQNELEQFRSRLEVRREETPTGHAERAGTPRGCHCWTPHQRRKHAARRRARAA